VSYKASLDSVKTRKKSLKNRDTCKVSV